MPLYECVFIARQDISSTQVDGLVEIFSQIIADNGGKVTKTEGWGLRTLAYRIKKNRKGHYVLFNVDAPAVAIQEMERNMRINEDVLRYLTIKVDELEEGPSVIMQNRGRSDRGDRGGFRGDRGGRGDRGDRGGRREDSKPASESAAPEAKAAPADAGPAKETPAKETPAKETPAEEASAEEASAEEGATS